ncbi:hypothetical protein [Sanguibacter sp. Z1732]|uniref:hypothetical protein n=1 Tax=Sanguibacter sp. Z1732 TaxID=3435412 RepID=UPI003D9C8548
MVWDLVRGLRAAGTSVILSTHVMEEAESLADQVVIMDRGVVVAAGSPGELTGAGEDVNRVHITGPIDAEALGALRSVATEHGLDVSVPSERALREVFLDLTGPEER